MSTVPAARFWIHPLEQQITQSPAKKNPREDAEFAGRWVSLDVNCATDVRKERRWLRAPLGWGGRLALGRI